MNSCSFAVMVLDIMNVGSLFNRTFCRNSATSFIRSFSLSARCEELMKLSRVRIVDNSFYANEPYRRKPRVIHVYKQGKTGRQRAVIGDKVLLAVRGQKMKAIVVGCRQMPGPFIPRFDTNNVVLLDEKGNPAGNRVTGKHAYYLKNYFKS